MHRVGIDVRMARHTGIGRYIRGFVPVLSNHSQSWTYTLIGSSKVAADFSPKVPFISCNVPIYSIFEQAALPFAAKSCDCLHVPHYNAPLLWPKKLVVTIHDLIHFEFAKDLNPLAVSYAKFLLPLIVKRADAIIAVSEHTKKDLVAKLNAKSGKITVIYHGVDPIFSKNEAGPKKIDAKPYFLYVGLIKSHKNLGILLQAFIQMKKKLKMPNLRLRIVGTPDRKQKIVNEWLEIMKQDSGIELTNGVSDQQLKEIYAGAIALVFPSLYEGFGFPLLEAMASQIPVIAANSTSVPEVLGDAGFYFDPKSQAELGNRMEEILGNTNLRQNLVAKGLKRLSLFDWRQTAHKIEKVYESVLQ